MNWARTKGRENLNAIAGILKNVIKDEIDKQATDPTRQVVYSRNDLPVRDLSLRLTKTVGDIHLAKADPNQGAQQVLLPYDDRECPKSGPIQVCDPTWRQARLEDMTKAGQVGIQHAIAGTIALLVHASRTDVEHQSLGEGKYFTGTLDTRDLDGDGVPAQRDACPVTGKIMEGAQLLYDVGTDGCPDPESGAGVSLYSFGACIREALASAKSGVFEGTKTAETSMDEGFQGIGVCEVLAFGEDAGTLEDRIDLRRQAWHLTKNFVATGDKLALRKEQACLQAAYPGLFPEAPATAAQLCACTLDSDGDGVSDCDDECPGTPTGTAVDTVGCSAAMGG